MSVHNFTFPTQFQSLLTFKNHFPRGQLIVEQVLTDESPYGGGNFGVQVRQWSDDSSRLFSREQLQDMVKYEVLIADDDPFMLGDEDDDDTPNGPGRRTALRPVYNANLTGVFPPVTSDNSEGLKRCDVLEVKLVVPLIKNPFILSKMRRAREQGSGEQMAREQGGRRVLSAEEAEALLEEDPTTWGEFPQGPHGGVTPVLGEQQARELWAVARTGGPGRAPTATSARKLSESRLGHPGPNPAALARAQAESHGVLSLAARAISGLFLGSDGPSAVATGMQGRRMSAEEVQNHVGLGGRAWVGGTRPGDEGFWLGDGRTRHTWEEDPNEPLSESRRTRAARRAQLNRLGADGAIECYYVLESTHAFVDVRGMFSTNLPGFEILNVTTKDGGIRASEIMGAVEVDDYEGETTMNVRSETGRISVQRAVLPGIVVTSGGPVSCSSCISGSVDATNTDAALPATIMGHVLVEGTGDGERVVISRALAGFNIDVKSAGDLIVSNSAAGPALGLSLSSRGDMVLSSLLMASGNQTSLDVRGNSFSASAVFSNRVKLHANSASLSVAEAFIGVATPTGELADSFKPKITPTAGFNYSTPAVDLKTNKGKLSLIGLGAAPADADLHFDANMQVDLETKKGALKVEVNGGGYTGNYTCSSSGRITVEIEEQAAPSSGVIGDPPNVPTVGRLRLESTKGGAIDLAVLDPSF